MPIFCPKMAWDIDVHPGTKMVSIPRSDPTFNDSDVIRIYERYLLPDERRAVESYFAAIVGGSGVFDDNDMAALRLTRDRWDSPNGYDLWRGILAGLVTAIDALDPEIGATEFNAERDRILAELEAYDTFIDTVPDILQPAVETILFPVKETLEFLVDILTPFYVILEARRAADDATRNMDRLDAMIQIWGPKL